MHSCKAVRAFSTVATTSNIARVPDKMRIAFRTHAQKAKAHNAQASTSYVVTVDVDDLFDEARQSQIRRIFESPIGSYVSEATLSHRSVHIVLHVPARSIKAVYVQINGLLPKAVVSEVYPRELDYIRNRVTL